MFHLLDKSNTLFNTYNLLSLNITNIPQNCWVVYDYDAARIITNIITTTPPAPYTDKWEIMRILKSGVENGGNEAIRASHLHKVQRVNNTIMRIDK